jgi:hypothetical protein
MQGTDRGRFSCKTRNGNWFEEMVLEDEKLREFLEKKERGQLTIQRIRQNLGTVEMTGSSGRGVTIDSSASDGFLHYGQMVRLRNRELACYLACDPGDAENPEEGLYSSTGSRQQEASARNVWVLLRVEDAAPFLPLPAGGAPDADRVRYGDKFVLSTTSAIGSQPFYLASTPLDWSHFSRVARKQLVFATQQKSSKCMWRIDSVGVDTSFDMEGEPVKIGAPVFVKHCSSGSPLAARDAQVLNDYGSEYELVAAREPGKRMMWQFITK